MRLLADMNELEDVLRHSTTAPSGLLRVDRPGIIGNLADSRLLAQTLASTRYVCRAAPEYLARRGSPASPDAPAPTAG